MLTSCTRETNLTANELLDERAKAVLNVDIDVDVGAISYSYDIILALLVRFTLSAFATSTATSSTSNVLSLLLSPISFSLRYFTSVRTT